MDLVSQFKKEHGGLYRRTCPICEAPDKLRAEIEEAIHYGVPIQTLSRMLKNKGHDISDTWLYKHRNGHPK